MPLGWMPRGRDFPRRNRIIAGMAMATVVIEAAMRSGTLITARRALEQDREVMAVPGSPLDPRSAGTNELIKSGARCVTRAEDVLEAVSAMAPAPFGRRDGDPDRHAPGTNASTKASTNAGTIRESLAEPSPETVAEPPTETRAIVLEALGPAPVEVDDIIRMTGVPSRQVAVILLELDLAGRLHRHPGNRVSIL